MRTPRPTSRPGFPQLPEWFRGQGRNGGAGGSWAGKRHGTGSRERGDPTCQGQKPTAWRRTSNTEDPLHRPRLAKNVARTRSCLLRKPLAARWGGEGRGREGLLQQAGIKEAEAGAGRGWCGWLKQYTLCTDLVNQSARPAASSPGPGALARGQGHQKGRAGHPTPSWHSRGEGRKCRRWRLPIQKRGKNSLNNGTKLRLSPRSPAGPRAGEWPQRSLCSGLGGISSSVSFVYCSS